MINHKHKFILVHVPKTGGTSIGRSLAPDVIPKITNYRYFVGWDDKNKIWMQHATMQQINDLCEKSLIDYFKFGFIRNPWDRAVSDYVWLRREQQARGPFTDYLLIRNNFEKIKLKRKGTYRLDHTLPQCDFLFDIDGNQLVDFIGRFENLQEDFNISCDKIGIPHKSLPHKHKSKHKHYTEHYNDETRDIVAEKYAKDIEMFGYKFGE